MYIYHEDTLMYLLPTDRWYLYSTQEISGDAYIKIHLAGQDYPLCWSGDLLAEYPGLDGDDVLTLYDAMVSEAGHRIAQGSVDYIDLPAIQAELLPGFLRAWRKLGYINSDEK